MSATEELQRLLATPIHNHHSNDTITMAHAALEQLRDSGDPQCLFLRVIMERPEDELLLFHCITGARQVFLWKWTMAYSRIFLDRVRDTLLSLGMAPQTTRVCRMAYFTSVCAMWKRGWDEETMQQQQQLSPHEHAILAVSSMVEPPVLHRPSDLFAYIQHVMTTHENSAVGATFVESLVTEFGSHSAVQYRMPLEFHRTAHISFHSNGFLTESLRLCMQSMGEHGPTDAIVQCTSAILQWESTAFDDAVTSHGVSSLVRAPAEWRDLLVRPELCDMLFQAAVASHPVRQLLALLASLTNPVFLSVAEQQQFAACLCDGIYRLLQQHADDEDMLLDVLGILSRLIANHTFSIMLHVPLFTDQLLQLFVSTGERLLREHIRDCEHARGNLDDMVSYEWREQALMLVIECTVWLCGDAWVLYSATEAQRIQLASIIGPLFASFVQCRTRMASLEEIYLHDIDLDEVREGITESNLAEEMESVAAIGRLDLSVALSTLSNLFTATLARLEIVWKNSCEEISAESAAVLEETRLLTLYIGHLLSDNPEGETPSIPPLILSSCKANPTVAAGVTSAVESLLELIRLQQQFLMTSANNAALSPMLAKTFLWFLIRWIPAYVDPIDATGPSYTDNKLILDWVARADQTVQFCTTLCVTYLCQWPLEPLVQDTVQSLLLTLARNGGSKLRVRLLGSPAFHELARFHCLTASLRHDIPKTELSPIFHNQNPLIWGYHRLPYVYRAIILTVIVTTCNDNQSAEPMLRESLEVVHNAFTSLFESLSSNQVTAEDNKAREMTALCIEMFCGLMKTTDIAKPGNIATFTAQYFSPLSNLMKVYATDLTICTALLCFFRDFSAHFLPYVDASQTSLLLQSCGELMMSYTTVHCSPTRKIYKLSKTETEAKEGQAYNDICCLIQLLTCIGTKEYLDACSQQQSSQSQQVAEMTFYGLQQILPLMTQGLLEYPDLCTLFFEFVSFITDNYASKIHSLSADLLNSLMEVLLFGMSNSDAAIGKSSLQGLTNVFRENSNGNLRQHYFDSTVKRLFAEVIFQRVIADRVEAAGAALLPFLETDLGRIGNLVETFALNVPDASQRQRLQHAFSKLLRHDVVSKTRIPGVEGRTSRKEFKRLFEQFVAETQAFLVIR